MMSSAVLLESSSGGSSGGGSCCSDEEEESEVPSEASVESVEPPEVPSLAAEESALPAEELPLPAEEPSEPWELCPDSLAAPLTVLAETGWPPLPTPLEVECANAGAAQANTSVTLSGPASVRRTAMGASGGEKVALQSARGSPCAQRLRAALKSVAHKLQTQPKLQRGALRSGRKRARDVFQLPIRLQQ